MTVAPRASKASRHYIGYKCADLQNSAQANRYMRDLLDALAGSEMSKLIASGVIEAEIDLAAFRGEVAWEDELDPALVAAVKAANVRIVVEHYDKFTVEGAPLAVIL